MSASRPARSLVQLPERHVLVLGTDALDTLLPGCPYPAQRMGDWGDLTRSLVRLHPASVALVDPSFGGDGAIAQEFWDALTRFPSATVVPVLSAARVEDVAHMRAMIAAGVSEIINLAREDHAVAQHRIRSAHARPFKRKLQREVTRFVSPDARVILSAAAEVAVSGGGVGDLARKFTVNPRTLGGWCSRSALPEPRRLQAWLRVLLASQLLDDPGRTMEDVAAACGYTADRSLRRVIKGLLQKEIDVRLLRKTGVFVTGIQTFNEELRRLREERRRSSPGVQPGKVVVPMQAHETRVAAEVQA